MKQIKPVLLVIFDGLGHSPCTQYNAVAHAEIPTFDQLWAQYPHTYLAAAGTAVGLPAGNPGNSEVGHLTIGTGRVIEQPITRILTAIKNRHFFSNQALTRGLAILKQKNGNLHIMGLLSDAGIHSHDAILYAATEAAQKADIPRIYIHAFLDGRDKAPESAGTYLSRIDELSQDFPQVKLASIAGRFYAMDRDKHWDRIEKSYRVLTQPEPSGYATWQRALEHYYSQGITDEFIPPTQLNPHGIVEPNDGIFFFNIRPDRARQITQAFIDPHFDHFTRTPIPLSCFITPFSFGKQLKTDVMLSLSEKKNTLTDILLAHHKTVFEIAETEKYAHVSYFFNGGRETKEAGEERILIDSLRLKSYDTAPCMSAPKITATILRSLQTNPCDFYVINYANADMVGHSGNFKATIKAVECLDPQLKALYTQAVQEMGGSMIITADHGNAEEMFDIKTNQPKTAHTSNKVPFIFVTAQKSDVNITSLTSLADIAPLILQLFGLPIPQEMQK